MFIYKPRATYLVLFVGATHRNLTSTRSLLYTDTGEFMYDQDTLWCAHPVYGLWFVFRAVVVFDVEWSGPDPSEPVPVLSKDTQEMIKQLTARATKEGWKNVSTLLEIRDSCPVGRERWRYEGDMLDYFYPIAAPRQEVINRVLGVRKGT